VLGRYIDIVMTFSLNHTHCYLFRCIRFEDRTNTSKKQTPKSVRHHALKKRKKEKRKRKEKET